jgi:hypothetical protein
MKNQVTITVSTRGRYFSTLPLCLMSIAMQNNTSQKFKNFILFDDNDEDKIIDLRNDPIYKNIFKIMEMRGILWKVIFGNKQHRGQIQNHSIALQVVETDLIFRADDDLILENNVLEVLLSHMEDEKVGAVGGLILNPENVCKRPILASNKIEDIGLGLNIQWFINDTRKMVEEVDHIYSSFLFRKQAAIDVGGYCMELSPKNFREETLLSYAVKRAKYKLLIDSNCITWHMNFQEGGIRSDNKNNTEMFQHDEQIFQNKLSEWGVKLRKNKLIIMDNGKGDHVILKNILSEIKNKYNDCRIIIAACYPEIFDEDYVTLISIGEARMLCINSGKNFDDFNIYKFCIDNNWSSSLIDAFRKLYL